MSGAYRVGNCRRQSGALIGSVMPVIDSAIRAKERLRPFNFCPSEVTADRPNTPLAPQGLDASKPPMQPRIAFIDLLPIAVGLRS